MNARPHFSTAQLAAFALTGRRDADEHREVRLHLRRGCVPCTTIVRRYETGRPTPSVTRRRSVPSFWLRPESGNAVSAVRAGAAGNLSIVCHAGEFALDLVVRELSNRRVVEFDGQVTRAVPGHDPVPRLELAILDANVHAPVARTRTNDFGEFGLSTARVGPYGLRLGAGDDAPCVLVWHGEGTSQVIAS